MNMSTFKIYDKNRKQVDLYNPGKGNPLYFEYLDDCAERHLVCKDNPIFLLLNGEYRQIVPWDDFLGEHSQPQPGVSSVV